MSESEQKPSLADVIVRLDRLEAALYTLIDAVNGQGPSIGIGEIRRAAPQIQVAPPVASPAQIAAALSVPGNAGPAAALSTGPAAPGNAAPGEPPLIQVAAPQRASPPPEYRPQMTGAAIPDENVEPSRPYDPYGWRTDIVVPGAGGTIQQVLTRVFEAGLMAEQEDTWAIMTRLTHPSQMVGPRALDHFKAFNWHKLRRTASTYLQNGNPGSFVIAYTDPAEVTPEVDRVRIFVKAPDNRMPVPVGFARDTTQGNAWRVTMMSL